MSKSIKVRLDSRTGEILEQLNEGIDTENAFITGTRIITVPQNVLRRSLGRSDNFNYDIDPRTEQEIVMQSQSSGTGGSTLGVEGDGIFLWNDVVRSNVTRVTTAWVKQLHFMTQGLKVWNFISKIPNGGKWDWWYFNYS